MKYLAAIVLASSIAAAQAPPAKKPADAVISTEHGQLLITQLKLAITQAQLANLAAQQTPQAQQAQQAAQEAQKLIDTTRIALGLDSTYTWDFQQQKFVATHTEKK